MCGIAGFVGGAGTPGDRSAVVEAMCRSILHRGPDDTGVAVLGDAAIGMRRLSVVDLELGHQPMLNAEGTVAIVFNGEVYNHADLRSELEALGHRFRTHSDTEAILNGYLEFGRDVVAHLRGMFAFAIWDDRTHSLYAARDRVGKKPFYYGVTPGGALVFGSELKSLLAHPDVGAEVDPDAIDAYLTFGYVPDPLSAFKGVRKLPPAHELILQGGRLTLRKYWEVGYGHPDERGAGELAEELRALLDDAVRVRLDADVPVGALLSGGVDSTAVVALMRRHTSSPVKTFSIGFEDERFSELPQARVAAGLLGAEHHELVVGPALWSDARFIARQFDEPFADPSAAPTLALARLAREHVTVVLTGDGGDELFGGYTRYATHLRRGPLGLAPRSLRRRVIGPLGASLPHAAWGRNFIHHASLDPLERYVDSVSIFTGLTRGSLYADAFRAGRAATGAATLCADYARAAQASSPLDELLAVDAGTYLPGDILAKVDRMTMAASLEARSPLLDQRLVEFAARVPAALKIHGGETKHLFKIALEGIVPADVLRRPKHGFSVPLATWINGAMRDEVRETITSSRSVSRGYLNGRYVATLLAEHERGRRDHATQLWALYMLELWHQEVCDVRARRAVGVGGALFCEASTRQRDGGIGSIRDVSHCEPR